MLGFTHLSISHLFTDANPSPTSLTYVVFFAAVAAQLYLVQFQFKFDIRTALLWFMFGIIIRATYGLWL